MTTPIAVLETSRAVGNFPYGWTIPFYPSRNACGAMIGATTRRRVRCNEQN
jgi:hypothetical protein